MGQFLRVQTHQRNSLGVITPPSYGPWYISRSPVTIFELWGAFYSYRCTIYRSIYIRTYQSAPKVRSLKALNGGPFINYKDPKGPGKILYQL